MADQFQKKFTPGNQPTVIAGISSRKRRRAGAFFVLTVIVFFLAVGSAVGLFFWQERVIAQNDQMREELGREKELFDPDLVRVFTDLKTRVESGSRLLDEHIAVSGFMNFLSRLTVVDVRFNNFTFTAVPGGAVSVNMSGQAGSYSSLAFQSRVFEEEEFIRDARFSGLNLDAEGNVIFNVAVEVDPVVVSFRSVFEENLLEEVASVEEELEEGLDEEVGEVEEGN